MATIEQGGGVGEYRIREQVRSGAAGSIFLAEQPALSRAVLVQTASSGARSVGGQRFLELARLLAHIHHPHLLEIYDVDVDADVPFAVMREPPGRSLREVITADGPLAPERAARLAEQLAAALETLDAAGVSVEQLSPEVVFLEESGNGEHAYLAPLEELVDGDASGPILESRPNRSAAALVGLLSSVLEPSHLVPDGPTPSAVATAARQAFSSPSRRRGRVGAAAAIVGVAAVAAVVAAVLATRSGRPVAERPVARKVATIPLGGSPRSLAAGGESVWVATASGAAVRVDPRTNEVVGQPIRFGKPKPDSNLTIRFGAGRVFVLDGDAGLITRIDPQRSAVTGRLHLEGLLNGAVVADGALWVLRSSPDGVQPAVNELLRIDPSTLQTIGKPYAVGAGSLDVEVRGGVAWVSNAVDGTVTRVDPRDGSATTVHVGAQPIDSAVRGRTLWTPDFWGDSVVPLDISLRRPPSTVVRGMHHPYSVAETSDALWVEALASDNTSAPTVLYRIDPASEQLVGKAVPLGSAGGWMATGFGSLWVQDPGANALVRYDPARLPAQAPARPQPARSPRTLMPGPLAVGEWRSVSPRIPFRVGIPSTGWLEVGPTTYEVLLGRFEAPQTTVSILAPTQLFLADGRVEKLPNAAQIVRALQANRHLVVRTLPTASVGGAPATRLSITVKPFKGYPTFCPTACVAVFGFPNNTISVGADTTARLSLVEVGRKSVVVLEQSNGSLATTGALVRSVRFR